MKNLLLKGLYSPILWGCLISLLFYKTIEHSLITNEFLIRYCAGHPIEYITVFMFFIGMASLLFKYISVRHEGRLLKLGPIFAAVKKNAKAESLSKVDEYIETVKEARKLRGKSLHEKRLLEGLTFLKNNGDVNELDQELRFLSEENAIRAEVSYGMVRMFIWAIPILGFLGTVVGITMALGNLDLTELETSGKLLADGLKVAFDTTALALSLVFVLYFSLFWVSGQENQLFDQMDRLIQRELLGRFASEAENSQNREIQAMNNIFQTLIETFEKSLTSQLSVWNKAIEELNQRSFHLAEEASVVLETVLAESLQKETRQYLQNINQCLSDQLFQSISPLIDSLEKSSKKLSLVETQSIQQSNIMLEVLHTTGEISNLEEKLNRNLQTVTKSGRFEEIISNLSETVQLLNSQLNGNSPNLSNIRLQNSKSSSLKNETSSLNSDELLLKKDAAVVVPFSKQNNEESNVLIKVAKSTTPFENSREKRTRTVLKLKTVSAEESKKILADEKNPQKNNDPLKIVEKIEPISENHSAEIFSNLEQLSLLTKEQPS